MESAGLDPNVIIPDWIMQEFQGPDHGCFVRLRSTKGGFQHVLLINTSSDVERSRMDTRKEDPSGILALGEFYYRILTSFVDSNLRKLRLPVLALSCIRDMWGSAEAIRTSSLIALNLALEMMHPIYVRFLAEVETTWCLHAVSRLTKFRETLQEVDQLLASRHMDGLRAAVGRRERPPHPYIILLAKQRNEVRPADSASGPPGPESEPDAPAPEQELRVAPRDPSDRPMASEPLAQRRRLAANVEAAAIVEAGGLRHESLGVLTSPGGSTDIEHPLAPLLAVAYTLRRGGLCARV